MPLSVASRVSHYFIYFLFLYIIIYTRVIDSNGFSYISFTADIN